jgi:CheY-like chemotaxis protein
MMTRRLSKLRLSVVRLSGTEIALEESQGCVQATTTQPAWHVMLRVVALPTRTEWSSDMSLIRILVVDDFKDWRSQVRLLLQSRPECRVIGETSDGPEAVQKAEDLKPNLILLDIGLPKLNGIEAAKQMRQRSPCSKIIFLSLNSDLDIVRAALGTGGLGYVHKMDAGRELLPAVDAVLRGKRFVSRSLKDYELSFADMP